MTSERADPAEQLSLSRQIHHRLREAIIRGRYPQGHKLAEVRIADELSVSRVPLREAVPMLEMEASSSQLLAVEPSSRPGPPNSSTTSSTFGRSSRLGRLASPLGPSPGRVADRIEQALQHSHAVVDDGDPYRIAEASTLLHERIVEATGTPSCRPRCGQCRDECSGCSS